MFFTDYNSSRTSSKQPATRSGERGAALAMAILMLGLLSAIAMTVLAVVQTESRVAGGDLDRTQAFYAATSGIEKMSSDFNTLFARTSRPTPTQLNNIAAAPPDLSTDPDSKNFYFTQTILKDDVSLTTMRLAQNICATCNPSVTVPNGPLVGLTASVVPYILNTTVTSTNAQVNLERKMNNYLVPIFQFGMFSNEDLEIHPGPAFTFNGRVHANGNLYLNGAVTFLDKVTTAGEVVRDVVRNGATHDGTVTFNSATLNVGGTAALCAVVNANCASVILGPNVGGIDPTSPVGTINSNWKTNSVAKYAGQLLTGSTGVAPLKLPLQLDGNPTREIIHRRVIRDDVTLSDSRYHSKAEIRILFDDEAGPADASALNAAPLNGDGVNNAGLLLSQFDPIPLPNLPTDPSPIANGGGRALWKIKDANTTVATSYDETAGSIVQQQQNGARQADTVRGVKPEPATALVITAASNASPIRITSNGHGLQDGDVVKISGVGGNTAANNTWTISNSNANTFRLVGSVGNANYTAGGTIIKLASSSNGTTIPSGAGIKGRILIQIIDANGVARDVTREILSMGMTEGEPNAIVTLQRPLWAAFTQGSRDGNQPGLTPNPSSGLQGDSAYANHLVDILKNTHLGALGAIRIDAANTYPTLDATGYYLRKIAHVAGQPLRSESPPVLNPVDWNPGAVATWGSNPEWNAIVPINIYNVREGRISTSAGSPSANANDVYERGLTSVVEINMRNLARWVDGVYDNNLLAGTNAVSGNITAPDGYTVYVSDRRGDKVKATVDSTGTAITATNGMVDNLDIYGPNSTMDAGEDVRNTGLVVGADLVAAGLKDLTELPNPASLNATSLNANTPLLRMQRAISVALWPNASLFRRSVRLFNGETLQVTGRANLSTTKGITVASENMVYIWGNYNTTGINQAPAAGTSSLNDPTAASRYCPSAGPAPACASTVDTQVPTSVVCDAYFQLSKTWFDSLSGIYPEDQGNRDADWNLAGVVQDETSVRVAVIAGNNLSALSVTTGVDAGNWSATPTNNESRLNGGMHNFPRFLEAWANRFNFVGSLIPLYHSTQALGQYNASSSIYAAPLRNWAFDVTFRQADRLPPGTPQFQYIEPTAFRQVLY